MADGASGGPDAGRIRHKFFLFTETVASFFVPVP